MRLQRYRKPFAAERNSLSEAEQQQLDRVETTSPPDSPAQLLKYEAVDLVHEPTGAVFFEIYTYPYDDGSVFLPGTTQEPGSISEGGLDFNAPLESQEDAELLYRFFADLNNALALSPFELRYAPNARLRSVLYELKVRGFDLRQIESRSPSFNDYLSQLKTHGLGIRPTRKDDGVYLDLGGRLLLELPPDVFAFEEVTHLSLTDLGLTGLPPAIAQLKNLQVLDLGGNPLTALPKEIGQLSQLTKLSLGGSNIHSLPPEIGKLTELRDLRFDNAKCISENLDLLPQLTSLNLYRASLSDVPEAIRALKSLTFLGLQACGFGSLPDWIGELKALESLDISGNHLSSLPPSMCELVALEELGASNNDFDEELAEVVDNVDELRALLASRR